ncbi:putative membrane protein [Microbacteriaceae bacterium SG_E_30_P1]|uniref:Membrane protein n=1 Tax=Antiquaquibacter oligotrophicus TaxID=2880260 RepID=A0ABT6KR87_9MICO|nr:YhgE/Pip domain-containing protein [Antiquaquibacter oligotrophicus]MDH6181617.1 putative membrane protein [Antiquaquibacter oligotrophicus]UDF12698.1 YhgE/Pip domain-containing protein [Antiquaquibacter oligotrophicus]
MSTPTSLQKRGTVLRRLGVAAVVLIPLAFAGLFVGALAQSDSALERIPAAVVNEDTMITTTDANGDDQIVFAGRQLVTELTGADGFEWTITNAEDAQALLDSGAVYAVLTVPSDFSESVLSLSSDSPERADITIQTDDSHSYLTGSVAQVVGQTLTDTFGREITKQYLAGLYDGMGQLGEALGEAADGADSLASGASQLQSGLTQYTGGVDSLAGGLSQLNAGASGLTELSNGIAGYANGVSELSAGIAQLNAEVQPNGTSPGLGALGDGIVAYTGGVSGVYTGLDGFAQSIAPKLTEEEATALNGIVAGLGQLSTQGQGIAQGAGGLRDLQDGIGEIASGAQGASDGGQVLASQAASAISGVQSGISQSASGASQLAAGSAGVVSGASGLADGASQLATGLQEGADQVPATDPDTAAATADVVVEPVGVEVSTANAVTDVGQGVATFFVPLGLWIGALAVFLVLRPVSRRALASTASNGRLAAAALGRAGAVTAAQAALLVALLHGALGVSWALLPATVAFSLVMALAFTAFHYLLTIGLGRGGLVVSLFLLAVQVTSTGGIYPVELLSTPFQVISPFLPLTWAVSGMQGIIAGGAAGSVASAAVILLAFGVGSVILSLFVIRRTRRADLLGLVPALA